jgi:hypothetical protein
VSIRTQLACVLLLASACDSASPEAVLPPWRGGLPISPARLAELVAEAELVCPAGASQRVVSEGYHHRAECVREDGVLEGTTMSWRIDGTPAWRSDFIEGVRHGVVEVWFADGKTRGDYYSFHGEKFWLTEDELGACPPESIFLDPGSVGHHFDLPPACYALHPAKGVVKHGPTVTFCGRDANDLPRVHSVSHHRWGEKHGVSLTWWTPDQLAEEDHYAAGKHHGPSRSWLRDGTLVFEGRYEHGKRDGMQHYYEPDGSPRWEAEFRQGELLWSSGDTSVEGQPCPDGLLPVGHSPPHGHHMYCMGILAEGEDRGPSITWDDDCPAGGEFPRSMMPHGKQCGPARIAP